MYHVFGYRAEDSGGELMSKKRTLEAAKSAARIVARGGLFADVKDQGRKVVYAVTPEEAKQYSETRARETAKGFKTTKTVAQRVVADIMLYGTRDLGCGWLAQTKSDGKLLGTGEPVKDVSCTEAVLSACRALRDYAKLDAGLVQIFSPDGQRVAKTSIVGPAFYGALTWEPAPKINVSVADIVKPLDASHNASTCSE